MALKREVDTLDGVSEALREHYQKGDDGKFRLSTEGEDPRVVEFRNKNIELLKSQTKWEGLDPEQTRAALANLAELEAAKPLEKVTQLEAQLAAEKAARLQAEANVVRGKAREALRVKLLSAGILPQAVGIALDKAESAFTLNDQEQLVAKAGTFSPTRPGEPLAIDEWLANANKELAFLFAPSSGGGSRGSGNPLAGTGSSVPVLRNPSPQQLGEHSKAIASGKMKVEYTND